MSTRSLLPRGNDVALVILDCDGVLFDSLAANIAFYDSILTALGRTPLDAEGRELCHRLSGPQLWSHLFADDPATHRRATELASRADYSPFYAMMRPARDLETTLGVLAAHCPVAMATNRGRTVAGVLRHFALEPFFAIRVGILDVPRPKPAPDVLHACLAQAGVGAEAAVYVGDTGVDRDAAEAADVAYVGIGTESGAEWIVDEVSELPALLGIPARPPP